MKQLTIPLKMRGDPVNQPARAYPYGRPSSPAPLSICNYNEGGEFH